MAAQGYAVCFDTMTTNTVSINDLSIPQLQDIARNMEQKIQFISASIQQLKALQNQFASSKNCLKDFNRDSENNDILVPLTATLCVPGKLTAMSNVIVDIGTGYYADMVVFIIYVIFRALAMRKIISIGELNISTNKYKR